MMFFSTDLYNLTEIQQNPSTGLPAVIQPTLPTIKECKSITVYYTCSGKWNICFTVSMFDLKALLLSEDWVFVLFVNLFYFVFCIWI